MNNKFSILLLGMFALASSTLKAQSTAASDTMMLSVDDCVKIALNENPKDIDQLRDLLDSEARRINSTDFIAADPVQFPRRFSALPDIEITALLASAIAWGNRKMICRDCEKMLAIMEGDPYNYVMDEAYEQLPDGGDGVHDAGDDCQLDGGAFQ